MSTRKEMMPVALSVPGANLGAYMTTVNSIPVLTADEERVLAERYVNESDVDAARQLVLSHLRFVVHIAKSYAGYGLPQGDLIQEGNVGLMKAVKRFDPAMGVRLVSFAVHWIKSEIHEYVIRNWRIVKVATTKAQRKLFFNLRSKKKGSGSLSVAEAERIASDLNVTPEQVIEMEGRLYAFDASFDAAPDEDDDRVGQAPSLLSGRQPLRPGSATGRGRLGSRLTERLMTAMARLDARSQAILARRWLAEDKATLHELAAEYGVSAERIRQLEKNAMEKIKATLTA
jgi:RNA polymerase sigma-32 factor